MVSEWERPQGESVEIEVEARPAGGRRSRRPDGAVLARPPAVESAMRGARGLRILSYVIVTAGVLGFVLQTFWLSDDESFGGVGLRQRIGNLLTFIWAPCAVAGFLYTASLLVTLYAARVELEARRLDDRDQRSVARGGAAPVVGRSPDEHGGGPR